MKAYPLYEGTYSIDITKKFIPYQANNPIPAGSIIVSIQPYLVITKQDYILLDVGLDMMMDSMPLLYRILEKKKVMPHQITKVLLSHLHQDHAGGMCYKHANGETLLSFPQATHYIQKREWEYAMSKGLPSYSTLLLKDVVTKPQIQWLEDNEGYIGDTISYCVTGAHSIYHQVFWIKEDREIIFYGGDDAPQQSQMTISYIAKYDIDGKKALQLRKEWKDKSEKENWQCLFFHDHTI